MAGYSRQSEASIQPGEDITAAPLNAEFDALEAAFDGGTGHVHDGTTANGPKIPFNGLLDTIDEDNMVTNSATKIPTQQSVKAYVDGKTTGFTVPNGGTGASTFTDGGVIIGNGTNALQVTTAGTVGQVLTSNGAGNDPSFQNASSAQIGDILITSRTPSSDYILANRVLLSSATYATLAGIVKNDYAPLGNPLPTVKITNPTTLPTSLGRSTCWSPDGRYLVVSHSSSPRITIYDWSTGSPVKITDPASLPPDGNDVSWSPNGQYLAVAHNVTPYVTIYDWSTGSPVKTTDPATLPANNAQGVSWSPSGRYMVVGHSDSPFITIYDWSTGSPVKITNPATLPPDTGYTSSWSPNGRYLAVAHGTTPYVTIYDWSTGSPVKITNPATLPTGDARKTSWSPNGRYLSVVHGNSPYVTIYDWQTGVPVKITNPATLPAGDGKNTSWSPDGRYLVVAHENSPRVTIYDWQTGVPVKITNPATLPAGDGLGSSWSPNGRYLAIGHSTTPFVTIYDNFVTPPSGWFYIPNVTTLPGEPRAYVKAI